MTISRVKAVSFFESFADPKTFTIDVGTGANRKIRCLVGRDNGTPLVVSMSVGSDTLSLVGSAVQGPGSSVGRFYCYEGDLTVTGSQTASIDYNDPSGGAWGVVQVYQGTGALTFGTPTWVDTESGSSGSFSGSVTATTSDKVALLLVEGGGASATLTPTSPATQSSDLGTTGYLSLIRDGLSGATSIGASTSAGYGVIGFAFTISEPPAAPVITGPSGAATGPTQATIGVTSDTAGSISSLILPAATAAPADAATLIADGAAVVRTIAAAGTPQTFPITGLTTNAAVKVHWAMAGSNVGSSAAFTPSTLAISGTALSAQTGTAGAAFVWAGATPESLITNTGNGSGSWTATAGVGASGVTVESSTGILVAGSLGTAGSYTITLQRADGSTVPGAQTVTKTVGLTISGGGGGDPTPPTLSAANVTGGTLSATGSVTSNEAGTLYFKMDGAATATDPGAGNEAGAGWSSQALLASANAVNFGVQPAGLRYGHYLGVDAAGNRATVVNASGTVSGSGSTTYAAQTDIIAVSGIALASTLVYWTWSPAGRPGAFTSPVNGSSTTDSAGRATISHTVAGDGMVLIGTRPGPVVSNDRVFAQFLTLA